MAVSTVENKRHPVVYRFRVSGKEARVAQVIHFKQMWQASAFWIEDESLIGETQDASSVGLWPYPAGGKPSGTFDIRGAQDCHRPPLTLRLVAALLAQDCAPSALGGNESVSP
jgi:hypothetical protein